MTRGATRLLMWASAVYLGGLGAAASFLPREILLHAGSAAGWFPELAIQLAGAGWIAFAVVNWAARGSLLGGIYGRPIALGNFAQFAIGAITLLKLASSQPPAVLIALTAGHVVFALCFAYVLFGPGPRATGV